MLTRLTQVATLGSATQFGNLGIHAVVMRMWS